MKRNNIKYLLDIINDIVYYINMNIMKTIQLSCKYAGLSERKMAEKIKMSPTNLHNRLRVGKFKSEELEAMADALGAERIDGFRFPDGTFIGTGNVK